MSLPSLPPSFLRSHFRFGMMTVAGFTLCALSLAANAAYSRQSKAAQAAVVGTPTPTTQRPIEVESDHFSRKQTPQGVIATLDGHAKIKSEDTTLVSALLDYNQTSGIAHSPGKLEIDDPQNTVKGNTGVAYYARRDAIISGNVEIVARPKPSDANAPEGSARREFKDKITITCDNVDYNWRTRVAVATVHLVMRMSERTVTADKAIYYGKEERVVLEGHVHYTNTNGEHGDSPSAEAILTEGKEAFTTGSFTGSFPPPPDEDDTTPSAKTKPADGPAPPATKPAAPKPTSPGTPAGTPPVTAPSVVPAPTTPSTPPPANPAPNPTTSG